MLVFVERRAETDCRCPLTLIWVVLVGHCGHCVLKSLHLVCQACGHTVHEVVD